MRSTVSLKISFGAASTSRGSPPHFPPSTINDELACDAIQVLYGFHVQWIHNLGSSIPWQQPGKLLFTALAPAQPRNAQLTQCFEVISTGGHVSVGGVEALCEVYDRSISK